MLPSEIKMRSYRGYHQDVFEGWRKLAAATIEGEGYTITFSRLGERTIDMFCDALNGWYTIWTKFRCEYVDKQESCQLLSTSQKMRISFIGCWPISSLLPLSTKVQLQLLMLLGRRWKPSST